MSAPYNVLFLCTGNSARSILAECIMNRVGDGKFVAYSASSKPKGAAHPEAIRLLEGLGFDTSGLRSKSWEEFAASGAPQLDFVITVCDDAAGEICPSGRAGRSRRIGAFPIPPPWKARPISSLWRSPMPIACSTT